MPAGASGSQAHVHDSQATLVQAELENLLCHVTFIYVTGITCIYLTSVTLEDGNIFITFTSFSSPILLVNMADGNPPICWCGSPKHPHIKGTWVPSGFARWVDLPLSEQLRVVLESRRIFPWAFTFSRSDYVTYLYEGGQGQGEAGRCCTFLPYPEEHCVGSLCSVSVCCCYKLQKCGSLK